MGLFGGDSKSTSNTTNNNYDEDMQAANYGDGLQLLVKDDASVTVDYLSDDVAKAAIAEAGMFAEMSGGMSERMLDTAIAANSSAVDKAVAAAGGASAQTDKTMKILTYASVATIAAVLIIGARKK